MPPSDQESCRKRRHATTAVLATAPLVASTRQKSPGSLCFSPGRVMAQAACSNPKHGGNCHKQTAMRALHSP
jgi:hypothetical protein